MLTDKTLTEPGRPSLWLQYHLGQAPSKVPSRRSTEKGKKDRHGSHVTKSHSTNPDRHGVSSGVVVRHCPPRPHTQVSADKLWWLSPGDNSTVTAHIANFNNSNNSSNNINNRHELVHSAPSRPVERAWSRGQRLLGRTRVHHSNLLPARKMAPTAWLQGSRGVEQTSGLDMTRGTHWLEKTDVDRTETGERRRIIRTPNTAHATTRGADNDLTRSARETVLGGRVVEHDSATSPLSVASHETLLDHQQSSSVTSDCGVTSQSTGGSVSDMAGDDDSPVASASPSHHSTSYQDKMAALSVSEYLCVCLDEDGLTTTHSDEANNDEHDTISEGSVSSNKDTPLSDPDTDNLTSSDQLHRDARVTKLKRSVRFQMTHDVIEYEPSEPIEPEVLLSEPSETIIPEITTNEPSETNEPNVLTSIPPEITEPEVLSSESPEVMESEVPPCELKGTMEQEVLV